MTLASAFEAQKVAPLTAFGAVCCPVSLQLINQFYSKLERLIQYGGSRHEQSVRGAFQQLLETYANTQNLELIAELEYRAPHATVYPDGTLKDALRQSRGYWESKDQFDDLDTEIAKKFAKGYPDTNILFDDSKQVALYQNGQEVGRAQMEDAATLDALLSQFVRYEPPQIKQFRDAIDGFKDDLPDLLVEIRKVIEDQAPGNARFVTQRDRLLELVQKAINPHLGLDDVREMLIQHILTEEIFTSVFNESQFHRENNVAHELHNVTETFFSGALRRNTLLKIEPYYNVIKAAAANIANHHEKQKFLKVVYETFYQAYNPAAADRLGIVYTPNEIVRFMIEAADYLTHKHFGKFLGDEGVNILDPATGTGTFITEIIEYLPKHQLRHKYRHELFCNEVALLPYYTANLNIEYTYQQKMGEYAEFENIAFVDTLENLNYVGAVGQASMFEMTAENLERIKRQNAKKISVIIGNPPYNANQLNENENNKNRPYPAIDERIKQTYVKESTAQKTKVYDMYSRFIRWASDRIGENGVIAYIVNRSFIDSRTFDGFRKVVAEEFGEIYVVDLGGDVRANPKLSGTTHNVFGIQTGVSIVYFVKKGKQDSAADIYYVRRPEMETAKEKLQWLDTTDFEKMPFKHIEPNKTHAWVNQAENEWESLLPVGTKATKSATSQSDENSIFKLFSLGISTNRDDWIYSWDPETLASKVQFLSTFFEREKVRWLEHQQTVRLSKSPIQSVGIDDFLATTVKWSRNLKRRLLQNKGDDFSFQQIRKGLYRPYCQLFFYDSPTFIDERGSLDEMFFDDNYVIGVSTGSRADFSTLASNHPIDLNLFSSVPTQCFPLYRYDSSGNRLDNITAWGLQQFREHYGEVALPAAQSPLAPLVKGGTKAVLAEGETASKPPFDKGGWGDSTNGVEARDIERTDIFHYTYAVLHDPAYREKYRLNLKREFPHIPFYADFSQWAAWGAALMALHLNYETIAPYPLERADADGVTNPKAKLKADKASGQIILDSQTVLSGVPLEAWEYKLGNRSALEWVLDRFKEKKPKDPTIRERFNTYRFADYKEEVIELLQRVWVVAHHQLIVPRSRL